MKPGSPGSWDRAMHRATSYVSLPGFNRTGRARWNLEAPIKSQGYYISVGKVDKQYGRSTHTSAYLTHHVRGVLLIWKNGKLKGSLVIWKCGVRTLHFRLYDQPIDEKLVCVMCSIERLGPRRPS